MHWNSKSYKRIHTQRASLTHSLTHILTKCDTTHGIHFDYFFVFFFWLFLRRSIWYALALHNFCEIELCWSHCHDPFRMAKNILCVSARFYSSIGIRSEWTLYINFWNLFFWNEFNFKVSVRACEHPVPVYQAIESTLSYFVCKHTKRPSSAFGSFPKCVNSIFSSLRFFAALRVSVLRVSLRFYAFHSDMRQGINVFAHKMEFSIIFVCFGFFYFIFDLVKFLPRFSSLAMLPIVAFIALSRE